MRTPMLLSFLSNFGGEVCRYRLWLWLILGARGGRGRWGGRMGGDVVRSERRVASLAVITKLVELGYLQPGARHRATAVEWAIDRLRMDLVGGSPAGAEVGLGHGRLGRDRPAAGAGGCGPPDRPGRDRQGETGKARIAKSSAGRRWATARARSKYAVAFAASGSRPGPRRRAIAAGCEPTAP
jgi:hypothetical protein